MDFKISLKGIDDVKELLSPRKLQKVIVRALDKTAKQGKTEAQRQIRTEYNIKLKDLTSKIRTDIHPSKLQAVIIATGSRLPLMLFNPKQQGIRVSKVKGSNSRNVSINSRRRIGGRGVTVEIKRGRRKLIKGFFIAAMGSGHIGVFERMGKTRLPIKERVTIDVQSMFGSTKVIEATKKRINEQWEKNFNHEFDREMKKK